MIHVGIAVGDAIRRIKEHAARAVVVLPIPAAYSAPIPAYYPNVAEPVREFPHPRVDALGTGGADAFPVVK